MTTEDDNVYRNFPGNFKAWNLRAKAIRIDEENVGDTLTDLKTKTQNMSATEGTTTFTGSLKVEEYEVEVDVGTSIIELKAGLTTANADIATHTAEITLLTAGLATVNANATILDGLVIDLDTKVNTLESEMDAVENKTRYQSSPATNVTRFENNVGINRSDPAYSLDVSGYIRATSGFLSHTGEIGQTLTEKLDTNRSIANNSITILTTDPLVIPGGTWIINAYAQVATNSPNTAQIAETVLGISTSNTSFVYNYAATSPKYMCFHAGGELIDATTMASVYYRRPIFHFSQVLELSASTTIYGLIQVTINGGSPFLAANNTCIQATRVA